MKRKQEGYLYFLIGLIAFLFVSMIVLCGKYLDLRINGISSSLPKIPEEDKWVLTDTAYDNRTSSKKLIQPSFVGCKDLNKEKKAAGYDSKARADLYNLITDYVPQIFSGKLEKKTFKNSKSRNDFIKDICNSKEFLYAEFYNEISFEVLLADIVTLSEFSDEYKNITFKYMFILPDENGNAYAVCFDKKTNAYILKSQKNLQYTVNLDFAYNDDGGYVNFNFASEEYPEGIYSESLYADDIKSYQAVSFYKLNLEDALTNKLIKDLCMNTNLVKTFTSEQNMSVSFIDNERELYVDKLNSKMYFNSNDRGIHLSEYLNYDAENNEYTLTDKTFCIKLLVNRLNSIIVGGEATPVLVSVENQSKETVFKLKYFYNGILITENDYDISITITDSAITEMEICALFCDSGLDKIPVYPQRLALELEKTRHDKFPHGLTFDGMYVFDKENDETSHVWVTRKESER